MKKLTPKQIPQRLPIGIAQVKTGNISENVLNEITEIICSLLPPKKFTEKLYNNIMNSIMLWYKS